MSIHTHDALVTQPGAEIATSPSRKRTRDEVDEIEIDRRPITIKQDASNPFARPLVLMPLHLLPRAALPLASLDPSQAGSRVFSAYIHILEYGDDEATVLIAKEEKGGRLYAVERVSRRKYALCRLAQWVKREELGDIAGYAQKTEETRKKRKVVQSVESGEPWWKDAAVEAPPGSTDGQENSGSRPMLAMRRVMDAPQRTLKTMDVANTEASLPAIPDGNTENDTSRRPQSPQDILQELAKHYLETLYLSRTSLAYFTKGPLSRARAAFSSTDIPAADLINFLRQCIFTPTIMDKKYRDGIPDIIKDLPVGDPDSPLKDQRKAKRKKKWKPKRDKNGLFVDEQEFVERWWKDEDGTASSGSPMNNSIEEEIRKRVSKVRNRETFLQIILALEVLALEASSQLEDKGKQKHSGAVVATVTEAETQDQETQQSGDAPPKPRSKKKQDLSALIETLLDKLTIWHSLESHSPAKTRTNTESQNGEENENDALRDFCIEVIIPFYASRIPQYASTVSKKLGGPSAPTPVKRSKSANLGRKPGEPAVRQPPEKKARRPLERVSTETLNQNGGRTRPPSLHRSATDSEALLNLYIKREGSESVPPLDSIPPAKPAKSAARGRASLMPLSKREVDLSAMAAASEAKLRKKAEVEEKLKDAISTLRKPDRERATREVKESADTSFAKAMARGANAIAGGKGGKDGKESGVIVSATPSRHATRVGVKATPHHHRASTTHHDRQQMHSSGGTTHVTSSSTKLGAEQHHYHSYPEAPSSTLAVPATGHRSRKQHEVEDTPSRGFARFMPLGLAREPGTLESPVTARSSGNVGVVQGTPSKSVRGFPASLAGKVKSDGVGATPLRPPRTESNVLDSAELQKSKRGGEPGAPQNIYEALGWEDEEYEELA